MTKKNETDQTDDAKASAEETEDEALDQAEGGFALSGMFTKTSTVKSFTNVSVGNSTTIEASDPTDNVDTNFLRTRPGRFPGGW